MPLFQAPTCAKVELQQFRAVRRVRMKLHAYTCSIRVVQNGNRRRFGVDFGVDFEIDLESVFGNVRQQPIGV